MNLLEELRSQGILSIHFVIDNARKMAKFNLRKDGEEISPSSFLREGGGQINSCEELANRMDVV